MTQAETYIVCLYDLIHVLFYSSETDTVFKKYRNLFLRTYKVKYRYLLINMGQLLALFYVIKIFIYIKDGQVMTETCRRFSKF